ncbi:MAG TPA: holo-ACP synthase [Gemmatimonadales bacterium]|jgi:holo-[acyl-carrier protein] synthase|nr:holo-ACP synthase [Gemmatimonadales bacterium]
MNVLGVGIDLVDIPRVAEMLARRESQALQKLLTSAERAFVLAQPVPARHVAARIAAKEAVYKALQALPDARAVGWQDIEVLRSDHGRPSIQLHGVAATLAERHGPLVIELSLSHSEMTAGAVAMVGVAR